MSTAYVPMGSFASGSYTVDSDIELSTQVFDGENYAGPGAWSPFPLNGCQMTVS